MAAGAAGAAPGAEAKTKRAKARTIYVSAVAQPGGGGSRRRPLASLGAAAKKSRRGDTIAVLPAPPSAPALDGGIVLKPRQRLIGAGPRLVSRRPPVDSARITNTRGDAVRLADRTTVTNLEITGAWRGAIYGAEVSRVRVEGNEVSGHNAGCFDGFHIPPFIAPTVVPGVGIPISEGLMNGWAGIMVDASRRNGGKVTIHRNLVRDAHCGDGIDIRLRGSASYRAEITSNIVQHLEEGEEFQSLLAFGLQTRDTSRLVARLDRNRQTELGNPGDSNFLVSGADSEGVFINPVGPSSIEAEVSRNTYTNPRALGNFSGNGLEFVSMGKGSRGKVTVRDSSFTGSTGDVIEEGGLGTDATLEMTLDNVEASRSTGFGNTAILPFNNGDCVLAGSLGARNTIRLKVRRSRLRGCRNNGLSVGSAVINGSGPTRLIHVDVRDSEITGNHGGNVGIRNFTGLDELSVRVENSDLSDSRGAGSGGANISADDIGTTGSSSIVFTGNCIEGGLLAAGIVRSRVNAAGNWWGRPGGPGPGRAVVLGGALDTANSLAARPASCR